MIVKVKYPTCSLPKLMTDETTFFLWANIIFTSHINITFSLVKTISITEDTHFCNLTLSRGTDNQKKKKEWQPIGFIPQQSRISTVDIFTFN